MNIQNTVWKCLHENAAHDAHKSGKDHDRNVMFLEDFDSFTVEILARPLAGWNVHSVEPAFASVFQTWCGFDVTDNNSNLGLQFPRYNAVRNDVEIRPAAGKKNAEPTVGRTDFHFCATSAVPLPQPGPAAFLFFETWFPQVELTVLGFSIGKRIYEFDRILAGVTCRAVFAAFPSDSAKKTGQA